MTELNFYNLQPLAVFGVSAKRQSFGTAAFQELTKRGIKTYAINPKGGTVKGQAIYASLGELPESIRGAVILTRGEGAMAAVKECSQHKVEWVWLQGRSDTPAVRELCARLGLKMIRGTCILLHHGGFPHSLHRFFHNLFARPSRGMETTARP